MKKILLFITTFLLIHLSQAQKPVVALPAMNVVYIGLDNPVQIAVEGYTNNQLAVGCENCTIVKTSQNYFLKATTTGTCKVIVSYKKRRFRKTDTIFFRVKSVPKPESMFGTLESGNYAAVALLAQNTIRAVMPNFSFQGITYKVIKCEILFVPKSGNPVAFSVIGNQIPLELKRLIAYSWHGDKILVDDITAIGPGEIDKRLPPIAITIMGQEKKLLDISDFTTFTYRENNITKIDTNYNPENSTIFKNSGPILEKGYKIQCGDTLLKLEINRQNKKVLWEKYYYSSGKLKARFNFENNDSMGTAKSYHENGMIKSFGQLVVKNNSMAVNYGEQFMFAGLYTYPMSLIDSFLFTNYAPIGQWKGYYENGKVALECTLNIYNYGKFPMKEGDPEIHPYNGDNSGKKRSSIIEAFYSKDSYFKPAFTGSFKLYDREGKIIKEENFKD